MQMPAMPRALPLVALLASSACGNYVTLSDRYTADPAPFVYGGRVYIYTSHDLASQTNWDMTDYSLMSSDDLTNWRDEGIVFDINANSKWGVNAWAQQVIQGGDGKFYMYWPGMHNRPNTTLGSGIGVAVSDAIDGPFVDSGQPLVQGGDDPTVFRDDNGTVYFCVNIGGGAHCAVVAPNMTSLESAPTLIDPPLPIWFEAPWLSKWNSTDGASTYYLSYMCQGNGLGQFSHYGWDICYGSCSGPQCSPLGPYIFRGSLMWNPPNDCGPVNATCADPRNATGENNHQGIFEFPPGSHQLWFAYHSRTLSKSRDAYLGYQRNVALDRLYSLGDVDTYPLPLSVPWAVNGSVPGAGPGLLPVTSTPSWVRQVKFVDAFEAIPAVLSAGMSMGLDSEPCSEGGLNLGFTYNGAWSMLRGVDFGNGAAAVILRVATPLSGGSITFIADGAVITTCAVPNTGGWQTWTNVTCPLTATQTGVITNLTLLFTGSAPEGLFNVLYFTFTASAGGGPALVRAVPSPVTAQVALRSSGTGLYWTLGNDDVVTASGSINTGLVWTLADQEDGTYTLSVDNKLACATNVSVTLNATTAATPCTRFWLYGTTTGSYGILAVNGLFVTATSAAAPLAASSADPRIVPGDGARHWLEQVF